MPFTAAFEIFLSTVFAASLTVSTGLFRTIGEVLKRRTWRASCVRNIVKGVYGILGESVEAVESSWNWIEIGWIGWEGLEEGGRN